MKKLGVLEEQLSGTSLNRGVDNSPKNSLSETLSISKEAKYFIGLLRHGLTDKNDTSGAAEGRKEADEPLSKSEFSQDSTVRDQAKNFLSFGIDIHNLCIHFDPYVKRDVQTAQIFCEEIGLPFPNEEELPFPKKDEVKDYGYLQEKYPYLVLTREVATREKGDRDNIIIPFLGTKSNEKNSETVQKSRDRVVDYILDIQEEIKQKNNSYSNHILIGHRTGTSGFLDVKYERKNRDLEKNPGESKISQLDFGLLNDRGEFINHTYKKHGIEGFIVVHDDETFEFKNYQQQVEEFKRDIPKMNILSGNNIINDTNIINEYLEQIKNKIREENTQEQVEYYLTSKSEIVRDYVLSCAVDILASQKDSQKELEGIVINYSKTHNISEEKKCRLFAKLYASKHEVWRYLLRNMYNENKSIGGNPIISTIIEEERKKDKLKDEEETKIEKEIEKFDSIKEYENIFVDTLLGDNISLKDFYVQQNLTMDGKTISSDDVVHEILTSEKKIFAIQAAGGSGKTMLSKYLLTQCANTDTLQKNDALHTWIKEINLNEYTSENIQDILQGLENILVIDALDEKNPDTVKSLAELSNSDEFKNSGKKIVVLGRYIENGLLYNDKKENEIKENSVSLELAQEVTSKGYIESFAKILRPELQEIFKKELSDILSKINRNLHTPIIIEMLANIVKRKLTSGRGNKIFVDEQGNEKTDITRKDIYDRFFQHLHEREDKKTDKIGENNERLYENNPFMGEKYDQFRKEFLIYLSMMYLKEGYRNPSGQLEIRDNDFQDIFKKFILEENNNRQKELIKDFVVDIKNIELFKESLLSIGVLKTDQNGKLSFHHKTFEEYFGYLFFEKCTKEEWIAYIQKVVSPEYLASSTMDKCIQPTVFKNVDEFKKTLEWYAQYGLYAKYKSLTDSILKTCDTIEGPIDIPKNTLQSLMSGFHNISYSGKNINKFMGSNENEFNELLLKNGWFDEVMDKIDQKKLTNGQIIQRLGELLNYERGTYFVFRNLDRLLGYDRFIADRALTTNFGCGLLLENLDKFKNLDRDHLNRKIAIMTTKLATNKFELYSLFNKETRDTLTGLDSNIYKIMIKNLTQTDFGCESLLENRKKFIGLNNKYIIDELMETKPGLSKLIENKDILTGLKKQDCQKIADSLIIKGPEYYYYLYSLRDKVIGKIGLNNDSLKKLMETGIGCSVLSGNINTLKNIDSQDYRYIVKKTIESGVWYGIWGIIENIDTLDFLNKDDHKTIADTLLKGTLYDVKILLHNLSKMKIDQNIYTEKANERIKIIKKEKDEQRIKKQMENDN